MGTLDLINLASSKIAAQQIPQSLVAAVSGISPSELSAYLNHVKPTPNDKSRQIYDAVVSLERLIEAARPLPIDMRRGGILKDVIEKMSEDRLRILVHETI